MNIILRRFVLSTLFLTVFTFMHVARAEAGKIIAVFGDAVKKKEPPLGWSYLWNANGEIGNSKNYSPLD